MALGAVALLQTLDNTMLDLARRADSSLWLVYVATIVGTLFNILVLIMASRPSPRDMRLRRRTLREMTRLPAGETA